MSESNVEQVAKVATLLKACRPIFSQPPAGMSWYEVLTKADDKVQASNQGVSLGRKEHPFDFRAVLNFKAANTHHSSCLETKRDATTGLGFTSDKVSKELNELCPLGVPFLDVLNQACDEYWQVGNGYIECVRETDDGPILGLHHLSASPTYVHLENERYDYHYEIDSEVGASRKFARFGDAAGLRERLKIPSNVKISEVIHFRRTSPLSRWYGIPDWMAAVPCIELCMAILQHNFDYFHNHGVPEFLALFLGAQLDENTWKEVKNNLQMHVGLGNAHKSLALNIPNESIKVQLEKLGAEEQEAAFQAFLDTISLMIVSAHRVPPLLAGIQIPGKLGANNELPNALMAVQSLVIGQAQTYFKTVLGATLGNRKKNGGLSVREKDFEFEKITDHINLVAMAETGAMRTPVGGKDPDEPNTTVRPDQKKKKPSGQAPRS